MMLPCCLWKIMQQTGCFLTPARSCDFENGDMCGWFENSGSSAHWTLSGFPASIPGPDSDHQHNVNAHDVSSSKNDVCLCKYSLTSTAFIKYL